MKLLLAALSAVTLASAANTGYNTGYNPCSADNLKETNKYICNSQGDVICMSGWQEPDVSDPYNPCSKPVCDFNGNTCVHGSCAKPYQCECEVGWCGTLCDECVPLPGCQYGYCVNEFDCICHKDSNGTALYEGQSCNEPVCNNCDPLYSKCIKPNECMCKQGWTGADCKTCVPLPGCANGGCARNTPGTCACKDGWTGSLCDQPICSPGCDATRGYCNEPGTCKCVTGWGGPNCNQCVKYWTCPDLGNCVQPNQCICGAAALAQDQANNTNVCNKVDINGPQYDAWGPCSNPCVSNANAGDIGTTPGTQSRACNWDSTTATGACDQSVQTQTCFGSNSWTFVNQNSQYTASIPQQCIFVVPATTAAPPPASSEAPTTPSDTTPGGGDANVVDEVVVTSAAPETTATPTTETTTTETTTTTTTTTPTTTTTATDPPITEA